jgi:hypothetical protein
MASFKQSAVVFSEKATPVAPSNPGEITVVARDGKLYKFDGVTETEIGAGDLSNYTLLSTTASISGDLQQQINSITVPTSASFLADYDARYVNVTGDTMTGTLAMSGAGIQLDVNHTPAHSEGTIFYDSQFKTLSYYNDNPDVTINVGQESIVRVRNNTGSLIANGKVVCIAGSSGSHPLIVLADNTSPTLSHSTLGVATHNISDNENGYVTTSGMVNGLNTSMFSTEGVVLWLDTNGNITETEPTAPTHKVKIGYLVRKHNTQGRILVAIDTGSDLKDLHDVSIGDYEDGALLVANGAVWQPGANVNDLATTSEVASISGSLQSQISAITVPTSATFLNDYDARYVNVTGDTMTGNLIISSGSYISSPKGTGADNEAFGKSALINNTTGVGSVAVGHESLKDNTIGNQNTSIGYRSLFANQVGGYNTATGCRSLTSNISGSNNTAIGYDSLYTNTNGTYNTATGYRTLFGNKTGNYNVGNGVESLYSLTAGDNNIAIGYRASYVNQTGSNNVTIGQHAGRNDLSSNKLYIDSSTSTTGTSATALIYGEFDTGKVWIKGDEIVTMSDLTNLTSLSTTASISGDLQTQIDNIIVSATAPLEYSAGVLSISGGNSYNAQGVRYIQTGSFTDPGGNNGDIVYVV